MDVRSEVAEFFNRDGLLDYPDSEVRFLPDEVIFTPGTRAGLAFVLEVLGADGSGVVVPRPSWEYDWFVERAGKTVVELPTAAPEFLPDPEALDRLLGKGGISSVILNNPHNPTGRVYPRALVEDLVRVAVKHRCVRALRLGLPAARLRGLVRQPGLRPPGVAGLGRLALRPVEDGHVRRLDRHPRLLARHLRPDPRERRAGPRDPREPLRLARRHPLHAGAGLGARGPPEPARRPAPALALHARAARLHGAGRGRAPPARRREDRLRRDVLLPARLPRPRGRAVRSPPQRHPREGRGEGLGGRLRAAALGRRRRHPLRRLRGGPRRRRPLRDVAAPLLRLEGRQGAGGLHGPRPLPDHEAGPARLERARGGAHAAGRGLGERVHDGGLRRARRPRPEGVRRGAPAFSREPAPRGPAPHGDEAPRLHRPPRRAARARPARSPRGRSRPRPPRPDPPRVAPADGGAARVRGVDRRPPRALQRGAARPRGTADQPGLARRPGAGRARSPAARHRPRRGPPPPLPRPQPLHRAGRGEGLEDPRLRRPRERPLPPRVRAGRGRAEAERHPRDHRPPGELHRRDRRRREGGDTLPPGGRGPLRRPLRARRRVPGRAGPEGASRGASRPRRPGPPRPPVRERRRPRAPARPPRGLLPRAGAGRRGRGPADPGDLPHLVRPPRGRRPRLRRDVGHRRAEREDRHRHRLHARPRRPRGGRAPPRRRTRDGSPSPPRRSRS